MVLALLKYYSFDLGDYTVADLARAWQRYDSEWVRHAVIECLYRGRYKAVSVHQILQQWTRRGEPLYHYGKDFERFICHDVPLQMRQASDNLLYFSNQPHKSPELPAVTDDGTAPKPIEALPEANSNKQSASAKPSNRSTMGRRSGGRRYPEKYSQPAEANHQALPNIEPKSYRTDVYSTALDDMRLLAKASIFTNKLRSMCRDVPESEASLESSAMPQSPTAPKISDLSRPNPLQDSQPETLTSPATEPSSGNHQTAIVPELAPLITEPAIITPNSSSNPWLVNRRHDSHLVHNEIGINESKSASGTDADTSSSASPETTKTNAATTADSSGSNVSDLES
ncbi:MAG: hypothetical protein WCO45_02490 [Pseudanabaena sp. ELA607]